MRIGSQIPGALDPIGMQDLGAYGLIAQSFEFLATLGEDRRHRPRAGRVVGAQRDRRRVDVQAALGRQVAGRHRLHVGRRRRHDGPPRRGRQLRPRRRHRGRRGRRHRPVRGGVHARSARTATSRISCRCSTPRRRSRRSPTRPAPRSTRRRTAPEPWKLDRFDAATGCTFVRNEDWWGGTTPLDSIEFTFFDDLGTMLTAMQGGAVDGLVQFSVIGGDALLNSPDFNVLEIESATHRQIWMRVDAGPVRRQARAPGARPHVRPRADAPDAVPRTGQHRQRSRHRAVPALLRRLGAPAHAGHRQGQAAARRRRGRGAAGDAPDRQPPGDPRPRPAHRRRGRQGRDEHPDRHRSTTRRSTGRSGARPSRPIRRARAPPSSASSTTAIGRRPTSSATRR